MKRRDDELRCLSSSTKGVLLLERWGRDHVVSVSMELKDSDKSWSGSHCHRHGLPASMHMFA